jgi:hypothetical protein
VFGESVLNDAVSLTIFNISSKFVGAQHGAGVSLSTTVTYRYIHIRFKLAAKQTLQTVDSTHLRLYMQALAADITLTLTVLSQLHTAVHSEMYLVTPQCSLLPPRYIIAACSAVTLSHSSKLRAACTDHHVYTC